MIRKIISILFMIAGFLMIVIGKMFRVMKWPMGMEIIIEGCIIFLIAAFIIIFRKGSPKNDSINK